MNHVLALVCVGGALSQNGFRATGALVGALAANPEAGTDQQIESDLFTAVSADLCDYSARVESLIEARRRRQLSYYGRKGAGRPRRYTEAQRQAAAERMRKIRAGKGSNA